MISIAIQIASVPILLSICWSSCGFFFFLVVVDNVKEQNYKASNQYKVFLQSSLKKSPTTHSMKIHNAINVYYQTSHITQ